MSVCSSPPPFDVALSSAATLEYSAGLGQPRFSMESALQNPNIPSSNQAMGVAAGLARQFGVSVCIFQSYCGGTELREQYQDTMIIQIAQFLPEEILYHCGNPAYTNLLRQQQYLRRQLDESNRQRDTCVGEMKGTKCVSIFFLLHTIFIAFTEQCTTYF